MYIGMAMAMEKFAYDKTYLAQTVAYAAMCELEGATHSNTREP